MKFKLTTYRTLSGIKKITEVSKKKSTKWIVYQDNQPKYFVDLFDLTSESNAILNSLVLCSKIPMRDVLKRINKKNNINLSLAKISRIGLKIKIRSEEIDLHLESIPKKWLDYSL